MPRSPLILIATAIAIVIPAFGAAAQDYPSRPIRAITTTSAGGISDIFMRALGEGLRQRLGQPIVVENRPGGMQMVGARVCQDSAPDGYTICIINADSMIYNQFLFKSLPFDPMHGLQPVTKLFDLIHMLVVNSDLKVKNVDELVALSKAKPGTLSYLTPGAPMVLYMETLKKARGADWVRVPFKGGGDAVNSMLTGTAQIAIFGIGNLLPFIRDGKIIGLAVDGDTRSPLAPDIPTFKELGYKEHISAIFFGMFAPAGTPKPIIDKLNKAIVAIESKAEFQQKYLINRGLTAVLKSPEEFAEELKTDRAEGLAVVKASGLYPGVK